MGDRGCDSSAWGWWLRCEARETWGSGADGRRTCGWPARGRVGAGSRMAGAGSGAVEDGAAFGWGEFAPVTRRE